MAASTITRTGTAAGTAAGITTVGRLPAASLDLLAAARRGLAEATVAPRAGERYALAHLAALRSAAALLAARAQPQIPRSLSRRPRSAWDLLARVAPELGEWAAFFAAGAGRRAAAEAGLPVVSAREADDLLRDAGLFLGQVEAALGLPSQTAFPRVG